MQLLSNIHLLSDHSTDNCFLYRHVTANCFQWRVVHLVKRHMSTPMYNRGLVVQTNTSCPPPPKKKCARDGADETKSYNRAIAAPRRQGRVSPSTLTRCTTIFNFLIHTYRRVDRTSWKLTTTTTSWSPFQVAFPCRTAPLWLQGRTQRNTVQVGTVSLPASTDLLQVSANGRQSQDEPEQHRHSREEPREKGDGAERLPPTAFCPTGCPHGRQVGHCQKEGKDANSGLYESPFSPVEGGADGGNGGQSNNDEEQQGKQAQQAGKLPFPHHPGRLQPEAHLHSTQNDSFN